METSDESELVFASDVIEPIIIKRKPRWDDDVPDPEATTYPSAVAGPDPVPEWVITAAAARQFELGQIKSGKEAEVFLVERRLDGDRNLIAAKRYRDIGRRSFRNDARYRQRRRTGDRRTDLAMARGTRTGLAARSREWASAEFEALARLWSHGVTVPYPVQLLDSEVMMEFIGTDEHAAPRLADVRLDPMALASLADQAIENLHRMTELGVVHGDLSPYNTLVWNDRLYVIDLPQVGHIADDDGVELLTRDVTNLIGWFARRGVAVNPGEVLGDLVAGLFG